MSGSQTNDGQTCPAHAQDIPLDQLPPGQYALVSHIQAEDSDLARLMAMGVCIGRRVRMVQAGDPMILFVLGARIGVSARMGNRVQVSPCPAPESLPSAGVKA